jgi:uncharacterized OB-fold protein
LKGNAMTEQKNLAGQVPVIDGWFTWPPDPEPHLIGTRCTSCGDYFFPTVDACRNPRCMSSKVEEVKLSRRGRLYTYSINQFPAPPPYIPPDPFVPYATGVIELDKEQMKVHGQISQTADFESLNIGMEMEVVLETLYTDEEGNDVASWRFKPL